MMDHAAANGNQGKLENPGDGESMSAVLEFFGFLPG